MARTKRWTIQKIQEGFVRFESEHGRLPSAPEVDETEYLPSARLIQKEFGGLETMRAQLGYADTHFGRGAFRSKIAHRVGSRGRDVEMELQARLEEMFGEVFVHTEKIFDTTKNRVDFYIYSPSGNFGIDVFYPDTMRSLQNNVNIKVRKYATFPTQLFLVVANDKISQQDVRAYIHSKSVPLPSHIHLICASEFHALLHTKQAYPDPLTN